MKLLTDELALLLAEKLLQNDKNIKDELQKEAKENYYNKTEMDTIFTSQKDELSEYVDEKVSESVGEGIVTATDEDIDALFS